jgi:hypothetical protein
MAIADGRTTVKALRERTKFAVRNHRAKRLKSANAASPASVNNHSIRMPALRNAATITPRDLFLRGANEALNIARETKAKLEVADAEIVALAECVTREWNEVATELRWRMSDKPLVHNANVAGSELAKTY